MYHIHVRPCNMLNCGQLKRRLDFWVFSKTSHLQPFFVIAAKIIIKEFDEKFKIFPSWKSMSRRQLLFREYNWRCWLLAEASFGDRRRVYIMFIAIHTRHLRCCCCHKMTQAIVHTLAKTKICQLKSAIAWEDEAGDSGARHRYWTPCFPSLLPDRKSVV